MSDDPKDGIERRDFMIASLATVGASAALAAGATAAAAQETATRGTPAGTVYAHDVIQGKPVITALDVNDLEPGKKHLFYFQGVQTVTGQHWYVSVMVAKGARPGKRIALISGVHGDEISPIHTIQTILSQLDPAEMSGTVMAVLDVSRPALEGMARRWPNSARGIDLVDMNCEWPGNANGASAATRHAELLFSRLFRPNADYAIDFHTGTSGTDLTAFHLARMDLPEVREMAELYPIDQIVDYPAYPGVLSNALIEAGIPSFTAEIGAPRILDHRMIPLFVEGTMNVLKLHGVIAGPMGRTAKDSGIFIANSIHVVLATHGGFVELLVKLRDKIHAGQHVAIQRNAFGEVVAQYNSRVAGEVGGYRSDATSEPGNPLVFILYNDGLPRGAEALPE